jgi:hypothetical protein
VTPSMGAKIKAGSPQKIRAELIDAGTPLP